MPFTISAETPHKMGSGRVWIEEVDANGDTKSGGIALTRFFILKDGKLVNTSSTEEETDAGGEKYTLASDAGYQIEGTVLSNTLNVDGFVNDQTKQYRMIFEGSTVAKSNGKIEYTYFGIVKVAEVSERSFTGATRTIKLNVVKAPVAINYTAPTGGLPGSKVNTNSLVFAQAQASSYVIKEAPTA